ncbi:HIG1 domain family member 2A, mitochondrial-like [Amphibalanus amphitrite]|uniref:HIG1 domain family member 2A, mitochondrial-like n=1 Tax=Amphibalanus amphitrite TaxID=1232801 RepID=UPI001C9291BB|nr:HIG1 domain family member 2A, mitochondrial-like [Amphibalanus amphitrite]
MAKDRAKAARDAGFDEEDLEWISSLRHDINEHQETAGEKFMRKLKSNPLVPIGCLATITALSVGLWNFKSGRSQASQRMMRMRVLAQGFTVAALIGGIAANALKSTAANEAADK